VTRGVEIHHDGDLPARSGAGTSSAFTVGLLHALHTLQGEMVSKLQLANEAMHLEQDVLCETVGSQDQVLSAYGGLNQITFHPSGEFTVRPIVISAERRAALTERLMLFYTGIKRTASDIAISYVPDLGSRERPLRAMMAMVDAGLDVLTDPRADLDDFGRLLHDCWCLKSDLSSSVSNGAVEAIYKRAREAGAMGGKLLGAGGGGFFLLFVPPESQVAVLEELADLVHIPFDFESGGSQIIFYDREREYDIDDTARARRAPFRELQVAPEINPD